MKIELLLMRGDSWTKMFRKWKITWGAFNPLTAEWVLRALTDLTLSNARRFYSSMGNLLDGKGLKLSWFQLISRASLKCLTSPFLPKGFAIDEYNCLALDSKIHKSANRAGKGYPDLALRWSARIETPTSLFLRSRLSTDLVDWDKILRFIAHRVGATVSFETNFSYAKNGLLGVPQRKHRGWNINYYVLTLSLNP